MRKADNPHNIYFGHLWPLYNLIDSFSTEFRSYHDDRSHYLCHSWVSPVLGWRSEMSCPRTLPLKVQRIQCALNPGPLDYKSNTLPQSHAQKDKSWPKIKITAKHWHTDAVLRIFYPFNPCFMNSSVLFYSWDLLHHS